MKIHSRILKKIRRGSIPIFTGYLDYLVFITGQACSLKCQHCANFSPYMPKEWNFYDSGMLIQDLNKCLGGMRKIRLFQIQGGEPFLYSDLKKLLEYVLEEDKIEICSIATNGTIIPSMDTLQLLKNKKFNVRISNYPIKNTKKDDLVRCLQEQEVKYFIYNFVGRDNSWLDMGKELIREEDTAHVKKRFKSCGFNRCLTLEDGKLGWCSRCIRAPIIQNFQAAETDYLDIRNMSGNIKHEIRKYILKHHYMEACRYCLGTKEGTKVPPAIQLK